MNLPLRTVFALMSAMVWAAGLSPAQSDRGTPAPAVAATAPQDSSTVPPGSPLSTPAAQTSGPKKAVPPAVKGRKGKAAPAPKDDAAPPDQAPYVIGSLDILEIKVWNDPKLSGIFDVRPDGILSLPLIGEMKADGLTVMELTQLIKTKLAASVMEDPEVNIQVARINSKKFYIFGGCLRQGEFALVGTMTILDAFANCGGFKDFANLKKIYVLRGTEQFSFNYKEVSHGKHMEQNRKLQNGDRIFVPE